MWRRFGPSSGECYRVLKQGGLFLGGYDTGINYAFDDDEERITYSLPFNPLKDAALYEASLRNDWGIQFSIRWRSSWAGSSRPASA